MVHHLKACEDLYLEVEWADDAVGGVLEAGEGLGEVLPQHVLVGADHRSRTRNQPNYKKIS